MATIVALPTGIHDEQHQGVKSILIHTEPKRRRCYEIEYERRLEAMGDKSHTAFATG